MSLFGRTAVRIQPIAEAELEARLVQAANSAAPAVVFGALWRDGTAFVHAVGKADLQRSSDLRVKAPMAWFSITKLFTATAVVQLAETGRLDLDAPVSRYLPERHLVRGGRQVTIRHLLSHSAGLPNPIPVTWVHLATETAPGLDKLVTRLMGTNPKLDFEPGERSSYSNLGYLLLGQVIERVSNMTYEEYLRRKVLDPLECDSTGFDIPSGQPTGYQRRLSMTGWAARWMLDRRFFGKAVAGYWPLKPFTVDGAPYGGLIGPIHDLLKFARMILSDGMGEHSRFLEQISVRSMIQATISSRGRELSVGLGWQLGREDGHAFAYHVGGGGGYHSELRVYPDLGYAAAVIATETSFPTESLTRLIVGRPHSSQNIPHE